MDAVSAAVATQPRPTWASLSARGAEIVVSVPGPVVTVRAPAGVASDLRAAIAWRTEAMRVQVRASALLGACAPTPVAVPGLALPLAAPVRWRGPREMRGRVVWTTLEAQRAEPGLCPSCGDAHAARAETGDCALCNAARVAALRAEAVLAPARPWTPPPPRDDASWRAEMWAGLARPDPLPPLPPRAPWVCEVCGATNVARRDVEGCGRCELRAAETISLAGLGGEEEAVFE